MSRYAIATLLLLPWLALAQSVAITGVTVIDATGAAPRPDMTVLVSADRIFALGKTGEIGVPADSRVVEGKGKFLIPGLWDMHVHWNDAAYLPLFIANGVTGIRIMWGLPPHLEQRQRIAQGSLLGPKMVIAGPLIDGPRPYWKESVAAGTREQGRRAVQRTRMLDTYDAGKARALYAKLKANGTWQVPTFTVLRFNSYALEPQHAADPRLRYLPSWVREMWASDPRNRDLLPESLEHQKRIFQRRLELVGEMHRAGVGILAGSDVLNPYCFPGFSLHDELEWLVKAGLSPMAALQAATRSPAMYLERAQDLGTVEKGKIADLVLLDADPLQDIRNTRRIAAVIVEGKLLGREALDRMLADIERAAN